MRMQRYEMLDDPNIPKFYYGSHYSSAGTVLHYLVRSEPFTSMFVALQVCAFYEYKKYRSLSLWMCLYLPWCGKHVERQVRPSRSYVSEHWWCLSQLYTCNARREGKCFVVLCCVAWCRFLDLTYLHLLPIQLRITSISSHTYMAAYMDTHTCIEYMRTHAIHMHTYASARLIKM